MGEEKDEVMRLLEVRRLIQERMEKLMHEREICSIALKSIEIELKQK